MTALTSTTLLARLIPLPCLPLDGDRLANLAAIERTLARVGCDLDNLAAVLDWSKPQLRIIHRDRPTSPVAFSARATQEDCRSDRLRVRRLLAPERLSGRERELPISVLDRIDVGRAPSVKRSELLADIHARSNREFARWPRLFPIFASQRLPSAVTSPVAGSSAPVPAIPPRTAVSA